ncbi:MAG: hypothetical protein AAFR59_16685, partial [Bacteroidota bacterium]
MNLTFFYSTDMRFFLKDTLPFALGLCLACLTLVSCENQVNPIENPIPVDATPAITIVSPENPRFSLQVGEQAAITLQMADNEALSSLRITETEFAPDGTQVTQGVVETEDIAGNSFTFDFTTIVDTIPPYSKLTYTCVVTDSKGKADSTSFTISVLPGADAPQPYEILVYENDTLYNSLSDQGYGFNFSARSAIPAVTGQNFDAFKLQLDIAENSGSGQGLWVPQLNSPNNEAVDQDSAIVITDASRFNYEEATYNSLFQAFFSAENYYEQTPRLREGDYVIVRLIKTPRPQFAIMNVKELVDD